MGGAQQWAAIAAKALLPKPEALGEHFLSFLRAAQLFCQPAEVKDFRLWQGISMIMKWDWMFGLRITNAEWGKRLQHFRKASGRRQ